MCLALLFCCCCCFSNDGGEELRQRWCVLVLLTVMSSAQGEPPTGTPGQSKAAGRLQEGNEMPGLHLLR